jgi:hypothetical protein
MKNALLVLCIAVPFAAQAQTTVPPADEQIAAAVMPLPNDLRAGATVLGYKTAGKLEVLREGKNGMRCLALYVVRKDFHVACYHEGLEAFMLRGRELRDQGMTSIEKIDSIRFAEVKSGKLKMPAAGALYSLTAPAKTAWDPATRKITGATPLGVIYMPFATTASIGLSGQPSKTGPWLMFPGTAKAHVMIVGAMQ